MLANNCFNDALHDHPEIDIASPSEQGEPHEFGRRDHDAAKNLSFEENERI